MIKGIIFDLDGTLLDTTKDIQNSLNQALTTYNLPKLDLLNVKRNLGNGSGALIKASVPQNTNIEIIEKVKEYYDNYYKEHNNILTKPYDGIVELLRELKKLNLKLGIASNKYQEGVTNLNETLFEGLFDVALGETKGMPLKPDPSIIHLALAKMKLAPHEVLYIGDTEVDYKTAINSNLDCVLVTWGFREKKDLEALNPNYIIDEPGEIIDIIKKR
ncbi:Haloacid dehalogenase superfamily, subfamily IA [Alteracholeplasma palmae J233]|uniref:Haloacid dehalogenase superfamily, subfamily IA n=1 Tax=Alteracholeplasma palmae (strain ATCC 49389 / J233) TaxID=1318466 RepID=U4KRU0_ALTPJ|nr:HAD family hydrolase [Alteracholeplasma palmae]CCV64436.1 Haloacid dehalogenase superfamily, subfamily IA [Alteracholeplasma palmae J233]